MSHLPQTAIHGQELVILSLCGVIALIVTVSAFVWWVRVVRAETSSMEGNE